jgi:hypothetical protein
MDGEAGGISWILAVGLGVLAATPLVWANRRGADGRRKKK